MDLTKHAVSYTNNFLIATENYKIPKKGRKSKTQKVCKEKTKNLQLANNFYAINFISLKRQQGLKIRPKSQFCLSFSFQIHVYFGKTC